MIETTNSRNTPDSHHICSPEAMEALAASLAPRLTGGMVVALVGDLGTGKSVFTRAAARELGVTDTMPSPSYTLVEEYLGTTAVLHIDLYRLADEDEFELLGVAEHMQEAVTFVEWADRAPSFLSAADLSIHISVDADRPECRWCEVRWSDALEDEQ